jgi:hypothetical protein
VNSRQHFLLSRQQQHALILLGYVGSSERTGIILSAMARVVDARTRALQETSTQLITKHHIEPSTDIKAERNRATFNVTDLLNFLNDGADNVQRRQATRPCSQLMHLQHVANITYHALCKLRFDMASHLVTRCLSGKAHAQHTTATMPSSQSDPATTCNSHSHMLCAAGMIWPRCCHRRHGATRAGGTSSAGSRSMWRPSEPRLASGESCSDHHKPHIHSSILP